MSSSQLHLQPTEPTTYGHLQRNVLHLPTLGAHIIFLQPDRLGPGVQSHPHHLGFFRTTASVACVEKGTRFTSLPPSNNPHKVKLSYTLKREQSFHWRRRQSCYRETISRKGNLAVLCVLRVSTEVYPSEFRSVGLPSGRAAPKPPPVKRFSPLRVLQGPGEPKQMPVPSAEPLRAAPGGPRSSSVFCVFLLIFVFSLQYLT